MWRYSWRGKLSIGLLVLTGPTSAVSSIFSNDSSVVHAEQFRSLNAHIGGEQLSGHRGDTDEVKPINIPMLLQSDVHNQKRGIVLTSSGEPKSGTTWTAKIIAELAVELCGSPMNTWCQMGGLKVIPSKPDAKYIWEMLHKDTGKLFMHFHGLIKHQLPGLATGYRCNPRGVQHAKGFDTKYPCQNVQLKPRTRDQLLTCLPKTDHECAQFLRRSRDPAIERMAVVFRDPRNVVISEHRMRINVYMMKATPKLETFIRNRFETIVAWIHQRWVWHTTVYNASSHIMFYEDIQESPRAIVDLAAFMGLKCSTEHAQRILRKNTNQHPHPTFDGYMLPTDMIEWMNNTMSTLLPVEMVTRYGLAAIYP